MWRAPGTWPDWRMSREGLYKALSTDGNPTFATVMRIAQALGMQVRIDLRA